MLRLLLRAIRSVRIVARRSLSPAIAAAAFASPALAAPLLWPLAEKTCVSGTFGEHRTGHFHAGIDLSTGGRIGLPVRAVAAGRVVRLRASPYGYGRAIYIDIDGDGGRARQVVYAHLSAFAPRWQALVEAEQERLGKYTVDFAVPESARVAAGEIVAYTGDSGGGGPHLHFEVREGDTDPINPLTHGWEAEDRTPPVIRAIRLVPLGLEGRVDGGLDPVVVRVARSAKDGVYRAAREPSVSGPVGVQVLASDRAGGCDDARAIFGASLALDDSVLFETEFRLVSYLTDWDEVDVRYDAAARAEGLGNFVRLYERVGWAGALHDTAIAPHHLSISIWDAAGNEAVCRLEIGREQGAVLPGVRLSQERLPSTHADGQPVANVQGRRPRVTWRLVPEGIVLRVQGPADATVAERAAIYVDLTEPVHVMPNGRYQGSATSGRVPPAVEKAATSWFVVPQEDLTEIDPEHDPEDDRDYAFGSLLGVSFPGAYFPDDPLLALGPFVRCHVGEPAEVLALHRRARLRLSKDALFGDALLTASAQPKQEILSKGLARRSFPARFDPGDLLLREKVEVRFAVPDSLRARAARLAVYSVEPDGSVECLGGALDAETGEIVAKTRALGTFVLLEDASRPRLSRPRPADGAVTSNTRPRLLVRVAETGEGLDDEGVRFTIDGERLIPEYDPDAGHIVARPKRPLARGAHRVEVRLADKAGNEATAAWRFTVTGRSKKR